MEDINRNGAYIQRRKMYLQYPFHNLKSKVGIDWDASQQKNRLLERQANEKEYIKQIYERKVENRLKERYSNSLEMERDKGGRMRKLVQNNKDALEREVEEFNTSKVQNTNTDRYERKRSEELQGKGQSQSAPSQSRQRQEDLHIIQKEANYQGRQNLGPLDRSSSGQFYPNKQLLYDYNQKQAPSSQNPESYTPPLYPYAHQRQPSIFVPPGYGVSPRSYREQPYPSDLEYHQQQTFRKYGIFSELPEGYGGRPFKNAKPDELEGFLRQKSKVIDRKNGFDLHLSYIRPEKKK